MIEARNRLIVSVVDRATGDEGLERHLTGKVSVKKPAAFRIMNKHALRTDSRKKVTGAASGA